MQTQKEGINIFSIEFQREDIFLKRIDPECKNKIINAFAGNFFTFKIHFHIHNNLSITTFIYTRP